MSAHESRIGVHVYACQKTTMCIVTNPERAERAYIAERVALCGGVSRARARRLGHGRHSAVSRSPCV
eukprot:5515248-Pleurochrysis_carterae.AAC.1